MRGAIIGDIACSTFENFYTHIEIDTIFQPASHFTDDTVCSVAIADAMMSRKPVAGRLRHWGLRYPNAGYGGMFEKWLHRKIPDGYGSFANGAVMRVSACAWLATSEEQALKFSDAACAPTHNHPDSIAAARAVTRAIYAGRMTRSKEAVLLEIQAELQSEIPATEEILNRKLFDVSAKGTTLTAAACLQESNSFEEVIRKAVYLGGDADTNAAVAGALAESVFDIPHYLWLEARDRLPEDILSVVDDFEVTIVTGLRRPAGIREYFWQLFH